MRLFNCQSARFAAGHDTSTLTVNLDTYPANEANLTSYPRLVSQNHVTLNFCFLLSLLNSWFLVYYLQRQTLQSTCTTNRQLFIDLPFYFHSYTSTPCKFKLLKVYTIFIFLYSRAYQCFIFILVSAFQVRSEFLN